MLEDFFANTSESKKTLEDAFFLKQDTKLIEELKAMEAMNESRESLAAVSGITNQAVLDKLVKLNVRPETLASLAIIPLVEVAWADGSVNEKERDATLKAATTAGFAKGTIDYELLENWLTHKPEAKLLGAWQAYIKGLCEELSKEERENLKIELIGHARSVASASGGILGLAAISKVEAQMIEKLETTFD
ncbi:MAG: hypothetical protein A2Y07_01455 [Planctomycetes bacterium GWF2_50_10]|nr:MAG: hypothetical protein A2Y07_01455 [Planctomycetes bacterium GWF2_50_10]